MSRHVTKIAMKLLVVLWASSVAATAGPPGLSLESLPDSFSLVYEVTPGGPMLVPGPNTSKLEARFLAGKGRLELSPTKLEERDKVVKEPWPIDEVKACWQLIAKSDLFNFKADPGSPAPDFGEVELACEASVGGKTLSARFKWTSPLRNDGQIWPLINHLDTLMAGPSPFAPKGHAPARMSIPPPPTPQGLPEKLSTTGELEMLSSLQATHLPLSTDETSMLVQKTRAGSVGDEQRSKMVQTVEILGKRLGDRK